LTARITGVIAVLLVGGWLSLRPHLNSRAADPPGALDVELEELRPGLLASYRSLADKDATLHRIDLKPAFNLGHSSPHPRIPAGPFEASWTGALLWKDSGPVTFDAFLGGEVTVEVDGIAVLQGTGESDTARIVGTRKLEREPGFYRLRIHYRSRADVPARLQIRWQGASFAREPLPAWQLYHVGTKLPEPFPEEAKAAHGRTLVGRLGCARCHGGAFPGVTDPAPGPSLADMRGRVTRGWLLKWLDDPARIHGDARMPALFGADRGGFAERWLIAEHLLGPGGAVRPEDKPAGDHRAGRLQFLSIGCVACHHIPDQAREEQTDLDRNPLRGLGDRFTSEGLAAYLGNPHGRYPDGRMPRLPLTPGVARDIAAYLLLWSKPTELAAAEAPTKEEMDAVVRRLKVRNPGAAAAALVQEKKCAECHPGLGASLPADIPVTAAGPDRGCLSGKGTVRYTLDAAARQAIAAYQKVSAREKHASPVDARRRQLERAGCVRCHQRDSEKPPPIEEVGSKLGGAFLQNVPYQRTPRLSNAHQKYTRAHLGTVVREGIAGLRTSRYTYRMPAFGAEAETLIQAIAEADGELSAGLDPPLKPPTDPTIGTLAGPQLVGFQGYACVSCHVWNGQVLSESDPGAAGPDLTRTTSRIRRDWFDRFLDNPARAHPNTPMPAIFFKGKASIQAVLDGDPAKQKEALWDYLAMGKNAPGPKPPPPLAVSMPTDGKPLVAQVPMRLPAGGSLESISILFDSNDLLLYDVATGSPHSLYTGAQVLRNVQGRLRSYSVGGAQVGDGLHASPPLQMIGGEKPEVATSTALEGYDRLDDGVRIRCRVKFTSGEMEVVETLRLERDGTTRRLIRELSYRGVPAGRSIEVRSRVLDGLAVDVTATRGEAKGDVTEKVFRATLTADKERNAVARIRHALPPAKAAPPPERIVLSAPESMEGARERPGYRAIAYPRPKTAAGQDLVMPGALAVHPKDGRVFIASMKMGEIFVLRDPTGDGTKATFEDHAHGLFQEAYSMRAEDDALYVMHRRNLTRIPHAPMDRKAARFDRMFALPHGIGETYDYGYGLVRDKSGSFLASYAPYANRELPGSGGLVRLRPGKEPEEIAFGFRNPVGWCNGPDGEVFFTDNQGEWVATNKLCHIVEGRYYGFPNPAQQQHAKKPMAKTAVWVPYRWARSINGVTYDNTGGKFGPFAGQIFMAELMFGGAIVRANVEKINGEYQGACFPFWGKGLLGPVALAFDPKGRLFVGGITEPGWMAQPDRGALFRLDFTGETPFEIQSMHVQPRGFRLVFTKPVNVETAKAAASYQLEHYRYEYAGAYGSPELDRTRVAVEKVVVAADGRSVDLTTAALVKDRVYLITARGVKSAAGEALVHPTGAYTLNEIPAAGK